MVNFRKKNIKDLRKKSGFLSQP